MALQKALDSASKGTIPFENFPEEMQKKLRLLDDTGDGFIEYGELKAALSKHSKKGKAPVKVLSKKSASTVDAADGDVQQWPLRNGLTLPPRFEREIPRSYFTDLHVELPTFPADKGKSRNDQFPYIVLPFLSFIRSGNQYFLGLGFCDFLFRANANYERMAFAL